MYPRFLRHRHKQPGQSRARSYSPNILWLINHSTARYGLHESVRILLLSLHVDRLNLGKVHYPTSYLQSHANGDPITRRLHPIRLRHSLEPACRRLLRVPHYIFFMGSTAVMDELAHFEPRLPIGAHVFWPPMISS